MLEGYIHPDFSAVADVLRKQIPGAAGAWKPGGAAVCVWHRGETVVDCWGGTRDSEGDPWEHDTMALSFSTTKGVAATLLHVLADRGLVAYDTPVCEYWPEFAEGGKADITVRQVLAHQAGLYHIRHMIDDAQRMLDWDHMTRALAGSEPCHEPGEAHGYHAFTFGWLVGEIVQRATGKSFGELLETELAKPLELDGLYIGIPEDQMHRRAQLIPGRRRPTPRSFERSLKVGRWLNQGLQLVRAPLDFSQMRSALMPPGIENLDFGGDAMARAVVPSANGTFTARSLAKLYAVLAAGGSLDGVRLVSQETLAKAAEVHSKGIGRVIPYPMHWRLGYHRVNTIGAKSARGFGHSGFGGSGAWADPDRDLAVALVLNSGTGTPFGDLRIIQIGSAAIRCADRR